MGSDVGVINLLDWIGLLKINDKGQILATNMPIKSIVVIKPCVR